MRFTKRFMFMRWALLVCEVLAFVALVFILGELILAPEVSLVDQWFKLVADILILAVCITSHDWLVKYHRVVDLVNECQRLQDLPNDKIIHEPIGRILNERLICRSSRAQESATAQECGMRAADLRGYLYVVLEGTLVDVKLWEEGSFLSFLLDNAFVI